MTLTVGDWVRITGRSIDGLDLVGMTGHVDVIDGGTVWVFLVSWQMLVGFPWSSVAVDTGRKAA